MIGARQPTFSSRSPSEKLTPSTEVTRDVCTKEPEGSRGLWDIEFCWLLQPEPFWPFFKVAAGKLDEKEEEKSHHS